MFRNMCHFSYHKYHKQAKVGSTENKEAVGQIFQQIPVFYNHSSFISHRRYWISANYNIVK